MSFSYFVESNGNGVKISDHRGWEIRAASVYYLAREIQQSGVADLPDEMIHTSFGEDDADLRKRTGSISRRQVFDFWRAYLR